jgi:hypothetical protein
MQSVSQIAASDLHAKIYNQIINRLFQKEQFLNRKKKLAGI